MNKGVICYSWFYLRLLCFFCFLLSPHVQNIDITFNKIWALALGLSVLNPAANKDQDSKHAHTHTHTRTHTHAHTHTHTHPPLIYSLAAVHQCHCEKHLISLVILNTEILGASGNIILPNSSVSTTSLMTPRKWPKTKQFLVKEQVSQWSTNCPHGRITSERSPA